MPRAATHRVPADARDETARTLAATPGIRGEPTDAERGRTLLATARTGALSTVTPSRRGAGSTDPAGFPFGSLVAYAVDEVGRPLLCLSDLAEHSRNLAADPRASLMVSASGQGDPLALARVTVLGTVTELRGDEREATLRAYRAIHPDAFYATFRDFRTYRLEVASVRYVGGFGRMSWVSAADHAAAEPDPLRTHVTGIVTHMNDDHADALIAYCRVYGGRPATATAEMVGVDRYGFTMLATDEGGADRTAVRIPFGRCVDTPGAVRVVMIELLREARAAR